MHVSRRRRRAVGIAAALLVALLALLLGQPRRRAGPRSRPVADAPPLDVAAPAPPQRAWPAAPSASAGRGAPTPDRAEADPPPIIDEIQVEKPEVCSGEENLVTVRAHTVDGTDAFLHYVIDGEMGSSVPLRLWLGDSGRVEGHHFVRVFGKTNSAVTVPLPSYVVKDCQPTRIAGIQQHLRSNSWGDFDFVASVVTLPPRGPRGGGAPDGGAPDGAKAFSPTSYRWSFGDGETATTAGPVASHSYEGRAQETLYSYFTVRVEVRADDGERVIGRTTLPLVNPAFEALARKGVVQLLVALDPRFPELGSDGRVVQRVRLWHARPDPVTIEHATMTRYFESAAGATAAQSVDVAGLLGGVTVPPGRDGLTTAVVLDTIADPGVFSITYRLAGHSREGLPVAGSFSVMRPPRRPTPDDARPVSDPVLTAKILAARAILGKDVVDDEEIWELDRQGAFARLAVPAAPVASAAPRVPQTAAVTAVAPPPPSMPPAMPPTTPPAMPPAILPTMPPTMQPTMPPAMPPAMPAPRTVGPPVPTSVTPPPTATVAPPASGAKQPGAR